MGCGTFCCRLIVQLAPGERDPGAGDREKSCLDKDPATGQCIYLDAATGRCGIWAQRPAACRAYDCNRDPKLQRVLREGYTSLTRLALASDIPPARGRLQVPTVSVSPKAPPRDD
jgi:hypothetical protein